jgi:hypothetical protein
MRPVNCRHEPTKAVGEGKAPRGGGNSCPANQARRRAADLSRPQWAREPATGGEQTRTPRQLLLEGGRDDVLRALDGGNEGVADGPGRIPADLPGRFHRARNRVLEGLTGVGADLSRRLDGGPRGRHGGLAEIAADLARRLDRAPHGRPRDDADILARIRNRMDVRL